MAKTALPLLLALALLHAGAALAQAPREITVTADSAPGWVPSDDQIDHALQAMQTYFAAADRGDAEAAYALLHPAFKKDLPVGQFASRLKAFNTAAGAVRERRVLAQTWTKDPKDAPFPGVYAALDLSDRFARIDRHCGYVILYQAPAGGDFQLLREEFNYMTNASANGARTAVEAERNWAKLSSNCHNYPAPPARVSAPADSGR